MKRADHVVLCASALCFVLGLSPFACGWLRGVEVDAPGGFAVKVSGEAPAASVVEKARQCGIFFIADDGGSASVTNYFNVLPKRDASSDAD